MVKDAPTNFRKLLKTYRIPSGISASIIPLREAESRGILLDLEEHPELASKITGYDALFSTGLSKDYVDKRKFNLFISIRELIQNALDEEELISGRPDFQIEQDPFGTWIVDRGRGITLEALRMGESNKECWMRGYYAPQFIKKMVRFWNKELQDKLIVEKRFSSEDCPREMVSAMFDFPNQRPNSHILHR